MEKSLPRRQAREHAFLFAFSATFSNDINLEEALAANEEDADHLLDDYGIQ